MQRCGSVLTGMLALAIITGMLATAVRAEEEKEKEDEAAETHDPSGTWSWMRPQQGQEVQQYLKLNFADKALSGKLLGMGGQDRDIESTGFESDLVWFEVILMNQGVEIPLYFEGKLSEDGNSMEGFIEVEFGGNVREFPWNPKRAVYLPDVVGSWQLHIESEDGQVFDPTLTLSKADAEEEAEDGKDSDDEGEAEDDEGAEAKKKETEGEPLPLKGVYNSQLGEIQVANIRQINDQVAWDVTYDQGGQQFVIKYHGRSDGSAMKGTVDYNFGGGVQGSLPFTGKRQTEEEAEDKEDSSDKAE